MEDGITIIYANRGRDVKRIKASLDSLKQQFTGDFEVVFVDYGSDAPLVKAYKELFSFYTFSRFLSLEVSHLLWNKSKALNYGIKNASFSFIFIADVDLIFHPESLLFLNNLVNPKKFFLFPLGYISRANSQILKGNYNFSELKPERIGKVNGMVLTSRESLLNVNGLDEFFHFYGAEDEDLFARLQNAGYHEERVDELFFYHNWHKSFSGSEDELLTGNPRVKNIMRINQRHFLRNKERGIIKPLRQPLIGEMKIRKDSNLLKTPSRKFQLKNILSHIEHFLREELPSYREEIIEIQFVEDSYYNSLKHKMKKRFGKQTQPYITLKEVNDMLLKEILFRYRDYNYSFKVADDLKSITFCIQM